MLLKWAYPSALLVGAIASQVYAIYLMPTTKGATALVPTAVVMLCFLVFTVLIGCLLRSGAPLNLVVPLMSAATPVGGILVGVLAYQEAASPAKIATLLGACLLVGVASLL